MRKIIERCPACGDELVVTTMECSQCHTRLEGAFRTSVFDRLSPESLAFVELFVRLKGNTKQMERELGVPYSTVRHRLDEVVRELGPPRDPLEPTTGIAPKLPAPDAERRRQILDRLRQGDISADEAVDLLGGEP